MIARLFFVLTCAAGAATVALAEGEAAKPAPAPAPSADASGAAAPKASDSPGDAKLAGYRLKNRSTFTAVDVQRPPFWPIGYVHQNKEVVQAAPKVHLDSQWFSVTSILLGNPSLAVINGKAYGEGEYLRPPRVLPTKNKDGNPSAPTASASASAIPPNLRIRVTRITDGTVTLQAEDQVVTVPLRRSELSERKAAEDEALIPVNDR